ncbi:Crp/Fnr family transcriptional regulator [Mucilaginibacter sp.]|uniref:Crp/Fnr family transcriptional regulator n=1 Tax=Mucilaginibacter sp. TaxID=1882438 RepID=UPI00285271C7|nr:Crp/Fnr family transcriptional regulator [Mucilaginibacter sp.]
MMNLAGLAHKKEINAGEIYIQPGSTSQRLAYIKTGLIRTYSLKENGDEVTLMLRWENQFVASFDSVILAKPSRFIYQALEDTTLLEVDYHKVKHMVDQSPELSASSHTFLLHMLGEAMDRLEGFVLLSPEERYLKLTHEKPDINNRVPDKYLATLLGVAPGSLSRIRKRIALQHRR